MNNNLGNHWLLLRGLARESAHWGPFIATLKKTFPDATISTLDLPGTGDFHKNSSPMTITAITDEVRQQAQRKGYLNQPVTLLAVSLGAMVGWEWMRHYPNDISGASLINTSFANLSPFYHRLRWQRYSDLLALIMTQDTYRREAKILKLVSNKQPLSKQISREWTAIQNDRPISLKNSLRQIIAAANYRPNDIKPQQPILLLNGNGDRLVSPLCSESLHNKWALELRSHPWAGHDLTLDDGEWVALQLSQWIAKKSSLS